MGADPTDDPNYNAALAQGGSLNRAPWVGSADADVDRYRRMGAQQQGALQLDQSQANESRGLQMGALGLMQQQANGSAPSAAAILSQRANQNAAMQASAAQAAAKGGAGAHLAALGAASPGAAGQAMAANAANANQRAAEIALGQKQYAGATQHAEGQDIQAATENARLEAQQRALNQQRQQGDERLAWNTRDAEYQGNAALHEGRLTQAASDLAAKRARHASGLGFVKDLYGSALGAATGAMSDERAKTHVIPVGSLGHLMQRGR